MNIILVVTHLISPGPLLEASAGAHIVEASIPNNRTLKAISTIEPKEKSNIPADTALTSAFRISVLPNIVKTRDEMVGEVAERDTGTVYLRASIELYKRHTILVV